MTSSQKTILLIKIAKILRMLGNGLLIILFLQNLYEKEILEQLVFVVQGGLFIGTMITSYLIKANQHRIGTKNALLLATLVMNLTSIVFAESQNLNYLVAMALLGMMPVIGQQLQIFSSIEEASLSKIISSRTQTKASQPKQKELRNYKIFGYISQLIGCIVASYALSYAKQSVQTQDKVVLYMMRAYTILCSLQFFVYLFVDKQQVQTSKYEQDHAVHQKEVKECIRPGIFMLLTFLAFFCTSILNMTNFLYFLHEKYEMEIVDVTPIIISLMIINHLGGYLAQKLVDKGCAKTWLLLGLPFNLMFIFVALTERLNKWQSITIVANLLTNEIIIKVWQKLRHDMMTQFQFLKYRGLFSFFQNLGSLFSIIVYAIFSMFGGTTIPYSVSIIICGAVKFIISIVLATCLSCLGNFSYSSKAYQQIQLHDHHQLTGKSFVDEVERLHLPHTH